MDEGEAVHECEGGVAGVRSEGEGVAGVRSEGEGVGGRERESVKRR